MQQLNASSCALSLSELKKNYTSDISIIIKLLWCHTTAACPWRLGIKGQHTKDVEFLS